MHKRKIIIIAVVFILLIACFFTGFYIQKARNNKSAVEYQNTISELGSKITGLQEANRAIRASNIRLEGLNTELYDNLGRAEERADTATGIVNKVRIGLSGTSGDIQSIIEAIDRVIEAVENTEDLE